MNIWSVNPISVSTLIGDFSWRAVVGEDTTVKQGVSCDSSLVTLRDPKSGINAMQKYSVKALYLKKIYIYIYIQILE